MDNQSDDKKSDFEQISDMLDQINELSPEQRQKRSPGLSTDEEGSELLKINRKERSIQKLHKQISNIQ